MNAAFVEVGTVAAFLLTVEADAEIDSNERIRRVITFRKFVVFG